MFNNPFKQIDPEVATALKYKFPERLVVNIKPSQDGGFVVFVENLPGCMTQAENGKEIFEMVNDAVYTYLNIPRQYQAYMPAFLPNDEQKERFKISIPETKILLQRV